VKQRGYGFAMLEHRVPATRDTAYELASVSKQFCSTAIMILVDDGKLRLDDKVSQYLPGTPETWSTMTVRNLLNHTSGISEFAMDPARASALSFYRYTNAQQLKDTERSGLLFKPGDRFQYSNSGYAMAGLIVEKASGQPYNAFIRSRILTPLGMTKTTFTDPTAIIPNRAEGYTLRNGQWAVWRMAVTMGALDMVSFGGIISTVGDLAKWDDALGTSRLLKAESWKEVWTPSTLNSGEHINYGLGWVVDTMNGKPFQSHSGHTGTYMGRSPQDHVAVIVLSNLGLGNPPPFGHDRSWPVTEFGELLLKQSVPKTR